MMTNYQEEIVSALLKGDSYITADELATLLHVSKKTVYRAITKINKSVAQPLIESERGLGYSLNYRSYLDTTNQSVKSQFTDFSPVERRNQVMIKVLFNAPFSLKLNTLYQTYHVSDELIRQDISVIGQLLSNHHLQLKQEHGAISVSGDEEEIRRVINDALVQSRAMNQEILSDFASEFADINVYDDQFLTAQLDWIQRSLSTTIPYPYNVNIFSHLFILIKRFRTGKVQESGKIEALGPEETAIIRHNDRMFKVANDVIKNTSDYLGTKLPEIESFYLLQYLISMRYDHDLAFNGEVEQVVLKLADGYIDGFDLQATNSRVLVLRNDLIGHLKPMLNRLKNHIVVVNKLLQDIKVEYGDLFSRVIEISRQLEKRLGEPWQISDDEAGFITLYFAKYFEEAPSTKKALIMCASGVGTSKLLNVKVRKAFPDLQVVAVISLADYERHPEKYADADLIISTVKVKPVNHAQLILSSAMFTKADRKRVEEAIADD
ncbi:BglG family transcription antiterminator [Secundilactobacillus kimchicus]|uniref:BglG family transcription antiterminator n=2 Tax=Secundilactobacillus kimchicus TaxID=528209 RepID=UPI0024A85DB7|nr:PRD domain-containing protein [Secundilactobacillus kimchicus]